VGDFVGEIGGNHGANLEGNYKKIYGGLMREFVNLFFRVYGREVMGNI
jgi:hypothetical protein